MERNRNGSAGLKVGPAAVKVFVAAIGRLKKGPEQELAKRYADRIQKSGKAVGITALETVEIPESRAADSDTRKAEEAKSLLARLPDKIHILAFDERGISPTSRKFSTTLKGKLDSGAQNLAFVIGGPDGLSEEMRSQARQIISFGALTLPHQLVRVMVLEQLYRAVTILTNHPYHRD